VEVSSYVCSIGGVGFDDPYMRGECDLYNPLEVELSQVRCPNEEASIAMMQRIDEAKEAGESLGGTFRVVASGLVPGVGGYATSRERLTSRIGAAVFSIPAIKGVEFGMGFEAAARPGSQVHDPITLEGTRFVRTSNNAGGLEGGMTTGMPLVVTAAMKPIPTLMTPLQTVNLDTLQPDEASVERSDVCAVPAAAVVAEGEVAYALAQAYLEMFGNSCMADIKASINAYKSRLDTFAR
jgi:chorismate synthase